MKYIVKDRREGGELVFLNIYFLYLIESWKAQYFNRSNLAAF